MTINSHTQAGINTSSTIGLLNSSHRQQMAQGHSGNPIGNSLKKLIHQIIPNNNAATTVINNAEKTYMAGMYALASLFDEIGKMYASAVQNMLQELAELEAQALSKLSEQKLNTAEKLQQQFPKLSNSDAQDLEQVLKRLDIGIYHDDQSNMTVLVAGGADKHSGAVQDSEATEATTQTLGNLVPLLIVGHIHPDLYTGHSGGAELAPTIANLMGDAGTNVMTFDAQSLNTHPAKTKEDNGSSQPDPSTSTGPKKEATTTSSGQAESKQVVGEGANVLKKSHSWSSGDNAVTRHSMPTGYTVNTSLKQHL